MSTTYNQGEEHGGKRPAVIVKHNDDGTVGLFAPEGDGDNVVFFDNVPEGDDGGTFQKGA